MSKLLQKLRSRNKEAYTSSDPKIGYRTGFLEFDYKNGMKVTRTITEGDEKGTELEYDSLGIEGGSIVTVLGPSGAGKTALVCQLSGYIARQFPDSLVIHNDVEGAMNEMRFKNLTDWTDEEIENKYVLKSDTRIGHNYLTKQVTEIYQEKMAMKEELMYNTGTKNKYGKDIHALQPTFIITDSIANLVPEDVIDTMEKDEEQRKAARFPLECAKANKQLIMYMTPMLREANIIYIFINHAAKRVNMSNIPEKAFINFMPRDMDAPGGRSPQYNSNNVFYIEGDKKFSTEKDDFFDGFMVKMTITKSRANRAGQVIMLPYNQQSGYNRTYHLFELLHRNDLLAGRSPNIKVKGFEDRTDLRFSRKNFNEKFNELPELRSIVLRTLLPVAQEYLSQALQADMIDMYDIYDTIAEDEDMKDFSDRIARFQV